jgi:hypothetical protein
LIPVDPVIIASARKHGVTDEQILHAYRNPIRVLDFDDLTMIVGTDDAGRPLEVGLVTAEGLEFIVHAMPARPKFMR